MFNKNRIILLITLAIILIIGFILVLNNLRPVSDRKRKNSQRLNTAKELKRVNKRISEISDSIKAFPENTILYLNRARLRKSINKYNEAIDDYSIFIEKTKNEELKTKAEKELKSAKKVNEILNN